MGEILIKQDEVLPCGLDIVGTPAYADETH